MCVRARVCVYVCVCVRVRVCACMCACVRVCCVVQALVLLLSIANAGRLFKELICEHGGIKAPSPSLCLSRSPTSKTPRLPLKPKINK